MGTDRERVVVTGLGAVTPVGIGAGPFWSSLLAGRCGYHPVTSFDTTGQRTRIGCEVRDFDESLLRDRGLRIGGRATAMAAAAAGEAFSQSGLDGQLASSTVGVCVGTTMGEIGVLERYTLEERGREQRTGPPTGLEQYPCSVISRGLAEFYSLRGPNLVVPTACAAGNYAIGLGKDLLLQGLAEVVVAGGVDPYSRVAHTGFNRLLAVSPDLCRPFDAERKGMIPGEGAGMLVLERESSAAARGAVILAVIEGYGLSNDAFHITNPDPQGRGLLRAMLRAAGESGLAPEAVDYISAHGTGTPANDAAETRAIKGFLGARARDVPVSSIKSMIGHTMGAASALEAVASVMSLQTGMIPPTMNYEHPDPECDLDYVPNEPRSLAPEVVLSTSMAFGGNNSAVIFSRRGQ